MRTEAFFHLKNGKVLGERNFETALSKYMTGLNVLIDHVQQQPPDGLITLGYSAKCMWQDIIEISTKKGIVLPPCSNIIGKPAYDLYSHIEVAKVAWGRLKLPYQQPLLLEDFVDGGHKIRSLHALFSQLGVSISYSVLLASSKERWEFRQKGIPVFVAIDEFDFELYQLLKIRKTPMAILT